MPGKHAKLLEDAEVGRWYRNVSRGSKATGDMYLRILGIFCDANKTVPAHLTQLRPRQLYGLLLDTVSEMEAKGRTGKYIAVFVSAVKSWLAFNGLQVAGQIKILGVNDTPTLHNERIPSQEELRRIFLSGDEKTRAVCVLLAHSGLREEVLGNYDGTDGLRISDFPETGVKDDEIVFKQIPTKLRVRSSLSKKRQEYFTFLGSEGCEYLRAYLEMRLRNGEKLHENSPIITPKSARKDFICTANIADAARRAIRKAGFPWRPYVLRSYFATQMMLAESKGLVIRDYRSFFMGHKGDIEAVYTLNKRKLPPEVVEQMRDSYSKAQRYLQTIESGKSEEELTKAFKRQLLLVGGFTATEIKQEHLDLDEEEFNKLVRERLLREVRNNQAGQQVVPISEVETRLMEGWEFVGLLPNDRAILKRQDVA